VADKSVFVRLSARVEGYVAAMNAAKSSTTSFSASAERSLKKIGGTMQNVGRNMTKFVTLPVAALGAVAVKSAVDWEQSWAGVEKVVDGSVSQLANLEAGLRDMSKELPATHAEIAAVAAAAGQLGVEVDDVQEFTKVMLDLGETTTLSAEHASIAIARIANIMETGGDEIDNFGSTLVELGNNSATTESEIVTFATRIAAAGKIAGMSEADILAFSSTLSSLGVEAEAGGTALSKVFVSIRDAVLSGGDNLKTFAKVAGSTAKEFSAAFREDPAEAIASFIAGLGRMNGAGESTSQVFRDLNLADQRLIRSLLSAGEAQGLLTDQLHMARGAWDANIALTKEAERRYDTTGSKLEMLRNRIVDMFITVADAALPALNTIASVLGGMADGFARLPGPLQAATVGMLGLIAAIGPITWIAGGALKNLRLLQLGIQKLGASALLAPGPWAKAAVGIGVFAAALIGAGDALTDAESRFGEFEDVVSRLAGQVTAGAEPLAVMTDRIREIVAESPALATVLSEAGLSVEQLAMSSVGLGVTMAEQKAILKQLGERLGLTQAQMVELGDALFTVDSQGQQVISTHTNLAKVEGGLGEEMKKGAAATRDAAAAHGNTTASLKELRAAAAESREALESLRESLFNMTQTHFDLESAQLALDDSMDDLTEKFIAVSEAQKEHGETSDEARRAVNDLRQAEIGSAEQALAVAEAYAIEQGAKEGSYKAAQLQIAALQMVKAQYPGLTEEVDGYISILKQVPKGTVTEAMFRKDAAKMGAQELKDKYGEIPEWKRTDAQFWKDVASLSAEELKTKYDNIEDKVPTFAEFVKDAATMNADALKRKYKDIERHVLTDSQFIKDAASMNAEQLQDKYKAIEREINSRSALEKSNAEAAAYGLIDVYNRIPRSINTTVTTTYQAVGGSPVRAVANGGLFNGATNVTIGEAGAEVAIPLTRPAMAAKWANHPDVRPVLLKALNAHMTPVSGAGGSSSSSVGGPKEIHYHDHTKPLTASDIAAGIRAAELLS